MAEAWRVVAAAFLLYVATAVVGLWVLSVAQLGRPDLASAVAVAWILAGAVAVAFLVRAQRRKRDVFGHP